MFLLHAHTEGTLLSRVLNDIFLAGLFDTLKLIPLLFLTYLLMEFIEHKAGDKANDFMKKAGPFAPIVGALLGAAPQCGFSASASNLYAGRIISMGTVIAVFLSTSDEMIPVLISGNVSISAIAIIVLYKVIVALIVGFIVDLTLRFLNRGKESINIDAICDEDNCHCERGIFYSALHHTATISLFLLLVTLAINALIFFVGDEQIAGLLYGKPFVSHLLAAILGLIPNCATSVVLSKFFSNGLITAGTMMAGLFSGAGVGLVVLFKVNKRLKENLIIVSTILLAGIIFGLLGDVIFPASLFS